MAKAYRQSNKYTYSNGQSLPLKAEKVRRLFLTYYSECWFVDRLRPRLKDPYRQLWEKYSCLNPNVWS